MSNITEINENNFQQEVLDSKLPVLVDFWASWCSYCNKLTPVLEELLEDNSDKLKVVKVNVDESKSLAQKYNVMSLPTMLLFKDGNKMETLVGYYPKTIIDSKISSHL